MVRILAIDDEPGILASYQVGLGDAYEIETVDSGQRGLKALTEGLYDIILLDISMGDMSGLDVMRQIREWGIDTAVIMVTVHREVEVVVEAMKAGANDYISKPFLLDELRHAVERNLRMIRLERKNRTLVASLKDEDAIEDMVYTSAGMRAVMDALLKAAPTDASVLITGESGTGKELAAQYVHRHSLRCDGPLVTVNCAAIPERLLESELFGHEKGAFSGADARKIGKFELANRGALFLDEISTLPLDLQSKLLRTLENRVIERVGATQPIHLDVRWIAATNRDLHQMVAQGQFREDLYFRLNVIAVTLPPLRERRDDIPLLADHFLRHFVRELKRHPLSLNHEVQEVFQIYDWPGNVRELRNLMERLAVLESTHAVSTASLPEQMLEVYRKTIGIDINEVSESRYKDAVDQFRRQFVVRTMRITGGNQAQAAELLGLHRNTLMHHLRGFNIRPEEYTSGAD